MLELSLIKYNCNKDKNLKSEDEDDEKIPLVLLVLVFIFYFCILTWAIIRALMCSNPTPDSRALHLLFCFVSPTLYLLSSYIVPGFCSV